MGCLGYLSLTNSKPITYLLGVQEVAMWEGGMTSHTWPSDTSGTNAACQVARATELGTVAPNNCGSWVRNLVRVTYLLLGILSWLLRLWENLCTSGVDCWKWAVNWKFWGTQRRSPAVWTVNAFLCHSCMTRNSVCITVNMPSAAHDGCNANSMLATLCRFRYKCVFRRGVYMCSHGLCNTKIHKRKLLVV